MTIDIIGAGIGGLTTAVALKRKGIDVRIYEQAPVLRPVGAGIILANNAMQVYKKLGLKQKIEQVGNALSRMSVTDASLQPISSMELKYFEEKYQVQNLAIHRGALQQVLVEELNQTTIELGHKMSKLTIDDDHLLVDFENGKQISPDYLIGADGIHSKVREGLFGKKPLRNAKQLCWRGVLDFDLPSEYQQEVFEAWGKGTRFGFVQIAPSKVYWFAVKSVPEKGSTYPIHQLGNLFKDFHPLVRELIAQTSDELIHTDELLDLAPLSQWHGEKVCLLGDAAHATTPNMGQGACQAIEDAYVLAECIASYGIEQAFEKFQQLRLPKAKQVVQTSWMIGKVAHWENSIATTLRNKVMKMLPEKMNRKQMEQLFELEI